LAAPGSAALSSSLQTHLRETEGERAKLAGEGLDPRPRRVP